MLKENKNNKNGITLIALIVTIVILLILSAVTVKEVKDTKIFGTAKDSVRLYDNAQKEEEKQIEKWGTDIDIWANMEEDATTAEEPDQE